jgi:DNA invertase Pin-like site-specific DNA recombinase
LLRSGFQALMRDALSGQFDVVLAEALDRFSRDQEAEIVRRIFNGYVAGKSPLVHRC